MLFQVGVDLIWGLQLGCGSSLRGWGRVALGVWGGAWAVLFVCWVCGLACGLVHGRVDYGVIDQAMWPLQLEVKVYDSRNQVPLYLWLHSFIILFPR